MSTIRACIDKSDRITKCVICDVGIVNADFSKVDNRVDGGSGCPLDLRAGFWVIKQAQEGTIRDCDKCKHRLQCLLNPRLEIFYEE